MYNNSIGNSNGYSMHYDFGDSFIIIFYFIIYIVLPIVILYLGLCGINTWFTSIVKNGMLEAMKEYEENKKD